MTYEILRLGHSGDGIADGPIYVPRALPGEIISGELSQNRVEKPSIVTPSPDRVKALCRHYTLCGGCSLQHASEPFVSAFKEDVVRQALAAHGITTEFRDIHTSPAKSRRRAKLSGVCTKKGATVGFHARNSTQVVPVPDCQILTAQLSACLPALEALTTIAATRRSEVQFIVTQSTNGLDVLVEGGRPLTDQLRADLARLSATHGFARLTWDDELIAEHAASSQTFGLIDVVPPPGAFLQATIEGQASLLDGIKETIGGSRRIVDLFAGCGTFSAPLLEDCEVHAVEGEAEMLDALSKGWRNTPGTKPLTVEARDLFRRPLLAEELQLYDAAVIDPPRAGASAQVAEIAASGLGCLAYVSCNPMSFSRDVSVLIGAAFRLNWVQIVDQFRWSSHVELVANLSRNG